MKEKKIKTMKAAMEYNHKKAIEALNDERAAHEKTKEQLKECEEELRYLKLKYAEDTGKAVPTDLKPFHIILLETEIKRLKEELNLKETCNINNIVTNSGEIEELKGKILILEQQLRERKLRKESTGRPTEVPVDVKKEILSLYNNKENKLSYRKIAAKVGISHTHVARIIKKDGVNKK